MSAERPLGERFSQVYLERGAPTQDSVRARKRFASIVSANRYEIKVAFAVQLERRTGATVPHHDAPAFLAACELRDFLDSITIYLQTRDRNVLLWREVESIFEEENLSYTLDQKGGVRFFQDEEFERSRASLIAGLGATRYEASNRAFEESHAALAGASPDTLTAVRRAFDAVENVFKMMTGEPRLGSSEITKKLKPKLAALPGRSADASKLLADGFSDWVNACHQYRHAEGAPEPEPPPMDLALALISSAATYLRWLVSMDSAKA